MYSKDKIIATAVRRLLNDGWRYMAGRKHGKLVAPNGRKLAVPCTPSDWRASRNFKRDVRRVSLGMHP
ncbi:hypothetical protein [Ralstonia pickettii]|jgi:hypothetical protein|uniref:hypothetical protein n=1 Tax=Ralstonia pickettii TaxID=329 RepID=UPI0015F97E9F|nr:hypothetical protein [Ralstonia pickettii]MBB0027200.1 hypothetical protein [Ralstonia pickettii]MBB0037717.1 hypothetical protein [Ralstonia pickettii]MBB0100247.1 hypothetical protein [Ralstonia pickettii]MBB0110245.1 hypothetical protein [Ralstonia pickettii]MBB0131309.1 hypothetical protein [Ralstonia pickettii]